MKKKQFQFPCDNDACSHLAKVLSTYVYAAFPIGGSECAQATRESLLDMAKRLADCKTDKFGINARQRPMLKSAINWYFSEVETDEARQNSLLEALMRR